MVFFISCVQAEAKSSPPQSPNFQSPAPDSLEAQLTTEEQDMLHHSLHQKQ